MPNVGPDRATPKRFRASLVASCDPHVFPMYQLVMLEEEQTDLMLYVVTSMRPDLLLKYLMGPGDTCGKVREDVRDLYAH